MYYIKPRLLETLLLYLGYIPLSSSSFISFPNLYCYSLILKDLNAIIIRNPDLSYTILLYRPNSLSLKC